MIKAGIIGCGRIAWEWDKPRDKNFNTHAKSYYNNPEVRLVSCADIKFDKAKALSKVYPGVRPYRDYRKMLDKENLDIVSVCTPAQTHYEILNFLLAKTGVKCIFAEKPLTLSLPESRRVLRLAKEKGVYIAINYLRRWDKTLGELKNIISSRDFGSFELGSVAFYGAIKQNAIHLIDFLNFLGLPLYFEEFLSPVKKKGSDFSASFLMRTKQRKEIFFHSLNSAKFACLYIDLFYEKARIRIGDYSDAQVLLSKPSKSFPGFEDLVLSKKLKSTICSAMKYSVMDLVKCCKRKEKSPAFLEREIKLMELVSQMERRT